jgi:hypothetical protein
MAAAITFFAGLGQVDQYQFGHETPASGLGFYGTSFGNSVQVDYWQQSTFITNAGGSTEGQQANNVTRDELNDANNPTATSGSINGANAIFIRRMPNNSGTLNLRFTYDSAVNVQNAKAYIYDRLVKTNNPSGVTCAIAELVHPWDSVAIVSTSGSATWTEITDTGTNYISLTNSPGESGLVPGLLADTQHDWYLILAASPDSIGSKTQFGLYFELEYL